MVFDDVELTDLRREPHEVIRDRLGNVVKIGETSDSFTILTNKGYMLRLRRKVVEELCKRLRGDGDVEEA